MAHDEKSHHHDEPHGVITAKVVVKDLLHACPQAEAVIQKHLGKYALLVPGSETETIEFIAAMHDYHADKLLKELNEVCKQAPRKIGHF